MSNQIHYNRSNSIVINQYAPQASTASQMAARTKSALGAGGGFSSNPHPQNYIDNGSFLGVKTRNLSGIANGKYAATQKPRISASRNGSLMGGSGSYPVQSDYMIIAQMLTQARGP